MRQAENDLEAARVTAGQGFHAQACYLAGQAAEKALKAVLVAAGLTPPDSHSLERLAQLLRDQGINTQSLDGLQLKALTRMSSESRSPQDDEAPADLFDGRDSDLALTTAAAVVQNAAAHLAG